MRKFKLMTVRNERQFMACTGLSQEAFDLLLPEFAKCWQLAQQQRYKKHRLQRNRKPGGGRKGALSTPDLKLFFILFYLKTYPTFDVLGCVFDMCLDHVRFRHAAVVARFLSDASLLGGSAGVLSRRRILLRWRKGCHHDDCRCSIDNNAA